ncbi:hypothetical protein [Acidithiobacillus ferrivorans]|uniref:Uncharacterized protein n=1 Tax=Acidithiobacillus ferrivorans TaxID=160808 RepID=A0A7T5BHN7_9PROT|nr:hypothetical protein [Acidithiobacillus ferrivorans]QQD72818.1 hypothetical protein H2515_00230 [Acidithiobacillus ferrivorans]
MNTKSSPVVIESVEPLSPHAKAVLEAGQQLFLDSVEVGREFCKTMVGTALTAIPVYVGLIKLFLPTGSSPITVIGIGWFVPVVLFLLSAAVSVGGHLPGRTLICLDLPAEIEAALAKATARRFWCGVIAFVFMAAGIIDCVYVLSSI